MLHARERTLILLNQDLWQQVNAEAVPDFARASGAWVAGGDALDFLLRDVDRGEGKGA